MDFYNSHVVSAPPGQHVVVVGYLLELVACLLHPDDFSACYVVPHMLTMSLQAWGQILLKVFKCKWKYFLIFQMQILLFSSNANANTFQKYFKYFFKCF